MSVLDDLANKLGIQKIDFTPSSLDSKESNELEKSSLNNINESGMSFQTVDIQQEQLNEATNYYFKELQKEVFDPTKAARHYNIPVTQITELYVKVVDLLKINPPMYTLTICLTIIDLLKQPSGTVQDINELINKLNEVVHV